MSIPSEPNLLARRWRWAGALRVAAYLALLGAGGLGWCVHRAYAEVQGAVLRAGQQLAPVLGPAAREGRQAVEINGQPLFLAAERSELSPRQVLDRLAAGCGETPLRVLRLENQMEGRLACFAARGPDGGLRGLLDGLRGLLETGDLSRLGDLRYAAVRALPQGGTQVVNVWSEGALRLETLFPASGDAPGSDMPDVPRPPDARRGLSASAPGSAYALRLYESRRSAAELLRFYERALPGLGWQSVPMLERGRLRPGVSVRAFTRAGRAVAVGVDESAGEPTSVSLIDLGGVRRDGRFDAPELRL